MLTKISVVKRSGQTVPFNTKKIFKAISGAANEVGEMTTHDVNEVSLAVVATIGDVQSIGIEKIQDIVEKELSKAGFYDTAKAYILYRQKHAEQRQASENLMHQYNDLLFTDSSDMDLKRDNANINSDGSMGIMLKLGTEGAKCFAKHFALPEKYATPHIKDYYHIHDLDFSFITFNCCQIDLSKVFKGGFSTGHGFLREPNSIRSAASLACIVIQSNQNDQFGGQSINALDYALAPYVNKSFVKHFKDAICEILYSHGATKELLEREQLESYFEATDYEVRYGYDFAELLKKSEEEYQEEWEQKYGNLSDEELDSLEEDFFDPYEVINEWSCELANFELLNKEFFTDKIYINSEVIELAYEIATRRTEEETKQAMEAMVFNFNTLHSRAGAQVPFSSINYGLDTSPEGRLVTDKTLDAVYAGLGNGETSIFPISVFQLKAGVNYNEGDPNYDLFKKACKVSAKRLFPNFVNIDAPYNLQYYKPGEPNSAVATMGCRTRVMSNINGPEESGSRGNFAFNTINLPMLALEAKEELGENASRDELIELFMKKFDKYIELSKEYLEYRYDIIKKKHVYNFPFLMEQGVWMDSEKLEKDDTIEKVLKHSSISIGFCGLAECLVVLTGSHHGADKDAQVLGLKIISHLRAKTDEYTNKTHMNWSCFATPAESTAGSFLRACRKRFGKIEGVTDRDYFTNSFHVPVYYNIRALDKIRIEAPYHEICNAGHISYIEMNGDPSKNVKAFEALVRAMHDANMGYFSINHPVDRDPVCGYTGVIENECPHCHRREDGHYHLTLERYHA